jgi:O-antigen/teichoic acid export membrane protein
VLPALLLGAWLLSRPTIGLPAAAASAVGSVLRAAAPLAVNGGLALLSLRIELIAIFFLRGSWEAGLFAAALKFVEALNGIPAALVSGALPSLTREALGGAGRSRQVRARTAAMLALLGVPAAFGMVLQAPAVLGLLGSEYTPGARSLRILAFAIAVLFTNTLLVNALIAVGRADRLPRLTGVRVGVAVLLALALVPTLGGPGAAIGFLIAELVLTAMAARGCVAADFPVPVLRSVLLAALLSLPMAAAVGLLRSSAWVAIGVGVVVYGVTLGTAWALGRDPLRRLLDGEQA